MTTASALTRMDDVHDAREGATCAGWCSNQVHAVPAAGNKQSLEVSYMHLSAALPILAVWTADVPKQMLEIYDRVVKEVALEMFAEYADIVPEMFVRIADLPIADSIRDLRRAHTVHTTCDPRPDPYEPESSA